MSESHKNRWKKQRELKYQENIKKIRKHLSQTKALNILLNSNKTQIDINKLKKPSISFIKITIRYITRGESYDDRSYSLFSTDNDISNSSCRYITTT